jgi:CRISPR-associated protein Cas5t
VPRTKGSKYNVIPVRREFLSNLKGYIMIDANRQLEEQVRKGWVGEISRRFGLPFVGDDNFLLDRLEEVQTPEAALWFTRVEESDKGLAEGQFRSTILIDREDSSKSRSILVVPGRQKTPQPPEKAWVLVAYPTPVPLNETKKTRMPRKKTGNMSSLKGELA